MLVGMASKISKTTHTSVWIAQDTTESRVPRLNVHPNLILAHTLILVMASLILLCLERSTHLYVYFLLTSLAIPSNITFWNLLFGRCISYNCVSSIG